MDEKVARMKAIKTAVPLWLLMAITSCGGISGSGDIKRFDYRLEGTWVSNDPSVYSGALEISYDRITITGYAENQTPKDEDDSRRPFRQFIKGAALKGRSEEGKIFIEDGAQEGIPYTFSTAADGKKFLRFTFGGRDEILESVK